jgi:hypothetical protein
MLCFNQLERSGRRYQSERASRALCFYQRNRISKSICREAGSGGTWTANHFATQQKEDARASKRKFTDQGIWDFIFMEISITRSCHGRLVARCNPCIFHRDGEIKYEGSSSDTVEIGNRSKSDEDTILYQQVDSLLFHLNEALDSSRSVERRHAFLSQDQNIARQSALLEVVG